jgi:hypothetical protein
LPPYGFTQRSGTISKGRMKDPRLKEPSKKDAGAGKRDQSLDGKTRVQAVACTLLKTNVSHHLYWKVAGYTTRPLSNVATMVIQPFEPIGATERLFGYKMWALTRAASCSRPLFDDVFLKGEFNVTQV